MRKSGVFQIVCVLQNAWGDYELPLVFCPNEYNKSAKTIRKKVLEPDDELFFCNTTAVVTPTASGKSPYNKDHFTKVIQRIKFADVIIVCGNQAKDAVKRHQDEINALNKPIIHMPHPASRSLSNIMLAEVKKMVQHCKDQIKQDAVQTN